jgi:hypothetical protein
MVKKKLYLTQDWIDACCGIEKIEESFKMYGYEVEVILIPYAYNWESNE